MTSGCRSSNSFADIRIRSAGGPTNVHAQVAAIGPTQLRKSLREPGEVGFCLRIVFIERHQSTDPPHAVGLLRARRERPRSRRAAEQRDERAASHFSITSSASANAMAEWSGRARWRANLLPSIAEYCARLAAAGFVSIEVTDATDDCLGGFRANLARWPAAERRAGRLKLSRSFAAVVICKLLAAFFGWSCKTYLLVSARKPS